MENFLRKLKLVTDFTVELDIEKEVFINSLQGLVDKGSTNNNAFEVFSRSKSPYVGYVGASKFNFRRRQRFSDSNMNSAAVEGTYRQEGDLLIITSKINGLRGPITQFFTVLALFYFIILAVFLFTGSFNISFLLVLLSSSILLLPLAYMRRSVKRMRYDLEREFYYATKARQ